MNKKQIIALCDFLDIVKKNENYVIAQVDPKDAYITVLARYDMNVSLNLSCDMDEPYIEVNKMDEYEDIHKLEFNEKNDRALIEKMVAVFDNLIVHGPNKISLGSDSEFKKMRQKSFDDVDEAFDL